MLEAMNIAILIGAGLIVLSVLTSLVSSRVGAPLLLLFLAIGLAAGADGPGGIEFDNAPVAYFIGSIALAIILFDSGFETSIHTIRSAAWPALALATVGVLLTTGLLAAAAHHLFDFDWLQSLLMGAIVSSTDAAAVFFLLRVGGITLRERVRSTLEFESSSNDPMAIFLTLTLVELIAGGATEGLTWSLALSFAQQMGIGGALGVLGGHAIVRLVNRLTLEAALYPVVTVSLAVCLFAAVNMAGGSGFLAVFVAGLIAGNGSMRATAIIRRFQAGLTWLAQIAMFLTLGLLATPSQFGAVAVPAIALGLFLIFVGRPLAVWLCLLPFRFSRNETTFVAWVGLRGAVSILLAILPFLGGLEKGQTYFNAAFIVVLTSLLFQGWTVRPMAHWLGLIVPRRRGPVDRVELELPGRATHEMVVYKVLADSPVATGERIPRWARPSLIIRDGHSMKLHQAGRLQPGDTVYIFTQPRQVHLLDRLFATPLPVGPDDREFFGDFSMSPDARLAAVGAAYGFQPKEKDRDLSLRDLLRREFGGGVEAGDRLLYGPVELIVREVSEKHDILEVGLAVEPTRAATPRLPLFQTRRDIGRTLRRWLGRETAVEMAARLDTEPAGDSDRPAA